jgi:hypothetical protein
MRRSRLHPRPRAWQTTGWPGATGCPTSADGGLARRGRSTVTWAGRAMDHVAALARPARGRRARAHRRRRQQRQQRIASELTRAARCGHHLDHHLAAPLAGERLQRLVARHSPAKLLLTSGLWRARYRAWSSADSGPGVDAANAGDQPRKAQQLAVALGVRPGQGQGGLGGLGLADVVERLGRYAQSAPAPGLAGTLWPTAAGRHRLDPARPPAQASTSMRSGGAGPPPRPARR